nr:hypothetical protein BHI3_31980 [Bacteriovorax sp. HI3]
MKELHLTTIHIISSIIATCALISIFVTSKGKRGHIILGKIYSIFSFITVLTVLVTYFVFFYKEMRFSTGRFSGLIEVILFSTQLFIGVLFIQKNNWASRFKTQKTYVLTNVMAVIISCLLLYVLYIKGSTLSVAFCGVILLNHMCLFIFGLCMFEIQTRRPEEGYLAMLAIHSSQVISSAVLFLFTGLSGTLGQFIFGVDANVKFNMKSTVTFPVASAVLLVLFFYKRYDISTHSLVAPKR